MCQMKLSYHILKELVSCNSWNSSPVTCFVMHIGSPGLRRGVLVLNLKGPIILPTFDKRVENENDY